MMRHKPPTIDPEILAILSDEHVWRRLGRPCEKAWDIYKALRDPQSHVLPKRHLLVRALEEYGISDPCPEPPEQFDEHREEMRRLFKKAKAETWPKWARLPRAKRLQDALRKH